mgnify:CR=1 FL=1
MADKLFGTDGIRGIAGHFPLNVDFCLKLATVLAQKICTNKKCVAIARDTRISGTMLQSALSAGFTAHGVNVLDLGTIPTPLCTTLTPQLNVDMSIMITASHNPYQDNGLKLITSTGDKFSDSQTDELERAIQSPDNQDNQEKIGTVTPVAAGLNNYLQTISAIAPANALKGLKIVLDAANGAFSYILAPVFRHLGAEIISLSDQPNGYNINENCGSQHTENLSKSVKENCYDFGIAVDGDGDRIILSDENGNRMNGDQIIAFLATYLQKHQLLKGNGVVATIYSNLGLGKYIRSLGLEFYATPVGERHVIAKMQQSGCNLGGEESGHMVLSDYSLTGDALIAAVILSLAIKEDGRKVSTIFPIFKPFPSSSHNLRFADKNIIEKIMSATDVQEIIKKVQHNLEGHGTVLVRKSGTEPVIRLKVEDEDESLAQKCATEIIDCINKISPD